MWSLETIGPRTRADEGEGLGFKVQQIIEVQYMNYKNEMAVR